MQAFFQKIFHFFSLVVPFFFSLDEPQYIEENLDEVTENGNKWKNRHGK
jgi:hypothetical protein